MVETVTKMVQDEKSSKYALPILAGCFLTEQL